jgi:two-component system sensor histidine kinase KdpD
VIVSIWASASFSSFIAFQVWFQEVPEIKPRIFDMFYSGANQIADSRRSLGLGLSLCKSIINAHGGELTVSDNLPHGTVFTFTLPAGEVKVYE